MLLNSIVCCFKFLVSGRGTLANFKQTRRLISHENPLNVENDIGQIRNLLEDKFNEVNVKLSMITEALEIKKD